MMIELPPKMAEHLECLARRMGYRGTVADLARSLLRQTMVELTCQVGPGGNDLRPIMVDNFREGPGKAIESLLAADGKRVSLSLEIPPQWIVLAAWMEAAHRAHGVVEPVSDSAGPEQEKTAQPYLERLVDHQMMTEFNLLRVGAHWMLRDAQRR